MDRETLSNASLAQLIHLADEHGVDISEDTERDTLEELIFEAIEEHRQEHRLNNNYQVRMEETKYETRSDERLSTTDDTETDELPDSYNETHIALILRDPEWAFAYWDLKDDDRNEFHKAESFEGLVLRIYSASDSGGNDQEASELFDIPVTLLDNGWYINLPEQQVHFRIALIGLIDGSERMLAQSNAVWSPKGALADGPNGGARVTEEILAQTGIQDLDVPASGKRVPMRILELVDEDLSFS